MSPLETTPLCDTHCHLVLPEFDQDREQVLERARGVGVRFILVPGIDLDTSRSAVEFAQHHPEVYAAVGVHPHHADQWNPSVRAELIELARSNRVVAIGEIGLDYIRDHTLPATQRAAFSQQIELAAELQMPVIVHNREAIHDILPLISSYSDQIGGMIKARRGVLHAFSAELQEAEAAISEGFYLGFAGPLTYKNADPLRAVAAAVPIERVILETDSPYLTPSPNRGKRNEPAFIIQIAAAYAEIIELGVEEIARTTTENARNLFRWNDEN